MSPGAEEVPADGIDSDCDGAELCFTDYDGDGFEPDDETGEEVIALGEAFTAESLKRLPFEQYEKVTIQDGEDLEEKKHHDDDKEKMEESEDQQAELKEAIANLLRKHLQG